MQVTTSTCQISKMIGKAKMSHYSTLQLPETKKAEFANSVDLDKVAHNEPPHLDLHYLSSSL